MQTPSSPNAIQYHDESHKAEFIAALTALFKANEEVRKAAHRVESLLSPEERAQVGAPSNFIFAEQDTNPGHISVGLFRLNDQYQVEAGGSFNVVKELIRETMAGIPYDRHR